MADGISAIPGLDIFPELLEEIIRNYSCEGNICDQLFQYFQYKDIHSFVQKHSPTSFATISQNCTFLSAAMEAFACGVSHHYLLPLLQSERLNANDKIIVRALLSVLSADAQIPYLLPIGNVTRILRRGVILTRVGDSVHAECLVQDILKLRLFVRHSR